MFEKWINFWKGKSNLSASLDSFEVMLKHAEEMFKATCEKLIDGKGRDGLKDYIYRTDKEINVNQREIRKKVVEHLAITGPTTDIPACLILMSVIKDAERIGDYIKNLYEVTELLAEPLKKEMVEEKYGKMPGKITRMFALTREAFMNCDKEKAEQAMQVDKPIVKRCDAILVELAHDGITANQATCMTLMTRYFKRITAHLGNVASSVILPVDELDYYDEKKRYGD